MKRNLLAALAVMCIAVAGAQEPFRTEIPILENEYWWGGAVGLGSSMPYTKPMRPYDLALQNSNNQVTPLLVSSAGRYVWSDTPFRFGISENAITILSDYEPVEAVKAGGTLREAYMAAMAKHFQPTGMLPDELFFTTAQYNTWIELMYNQNQRDVLAYAENIVANGFPAGVLMIDDNWQKYYGNFEFKPERFTDPKEMVDKLHTMGFRVMVWVCPFVSADSPEYRELAAKGYLVRAKGSRSPAVINWWNGQSASYDFTNPEATAHYIALLKKVQEQYGVDGFKFDAGDNNFYNPARIDSFKKDAMSVDHTESWARIGLEFPFNEYRAGWKMGLEPLVQRLGDKHSSWSHLRALIPEMTAAGLMGYAYTCPDMIGGGQYASFFGKRPEDLDQRLIVRSAQVHALMPMMQFSVAPWRVLDTQHLAVAKRTAELHDLFAPYIMECAHAASRSGEPIVRHMEYEFPEEGFAECSDQFMLGGRYMVAPVVTDGDSRTVKLPKGRWKDDLGKIWRGGQTITVDAPLERLPRFERMER